LRPRSESPLCRIIPARAGFTQGNKMMGDAHRDHPRSRGVYHSPAPPFPTHSGSSPLARGLLSPPPACEPRHRIIPARAGFTSRVVWRLRSRRDHPRSRGVYKTHDSPHTNCPGSSPLARGLLFGTFVPCFPRRIIPARAGFTSAAHAASAASRDHPRSRGVYYGPL